METTLVTAVLCHDDEGFAAWCRANPFRYAGDGAEGHNPRWLALRVLQADDLAGVLIDRIDFAVDFWRNGDRETTLALEAVARNSLRSRLATPPDR